MSDWDLILDEMERRVELAERFLAGEHVEISEFERPYALGPMPAAFAARARQVHEATVAVEVRMTEELERIGGALRRGTPNRTYAAERPEPIFFDRSA